MINQNLINNLPNNSGFLHNHITNPIETSNYKVVKGPKSGCWEVYNYSDVNMLYNDSEIIITEYAKNLNNRNFSSILFGGLGLGILPYLSQDLSDVIDVVEIDNEIINLVNNIGHLDSKVNIIQGDIFNYETVEKYDVILIDIWNKQEYSLIQTQTSFLTQKFSTNLNENGMIYHPILEWFKIN